MLLLWLDGTVTRLTPLNLTYCLLITDRPSSIEALSAASCNTIFVWMPLMTLIGCVELNLMPNLLYLLAIHLLVQTPSSQCYCCCSPSSLLDNHGRSVSIPALVLLNAHGGGQLLGLVSLVNLLCG